MPHPGLRGRLYLTVVAVVALVIVGLTAGFNLLLTRRLDRDATELARARATSDLSGVRVRRGRPTVPEAPDDRSVGSLGWVFAGGRALEAPRVGAATTAAARSLAASGRHSRDVNGTRLYAADISRGRRSLGTVVAGVSLKPYERSRHAALVGSLVLDGALVLALALAARWLIAGALRPVSRMTAQAAEWSERDLDRRFGLGPATDEFTRLAATLDELLDRLAASLRREQRFSAEVSHELRTPLSGLIAEAQLALRQQRTGDQYRTAVAQMLDSATQMARTLDVLVATARAELGETHRGTSAAEEGASAAVDACSKLAAESSVSITLAPPEHSLRVGADPDLVERVLFPLIENACRHATARVEVVITHSSNAIVFTVRDDGPGVADREREAIFEPGRRAAGAGDGGAGLGLALSRRLAQAVNGQVEALPDGEGGQFVARLPAA